MSFIKPVAAPVSAGGSWRHHKYGIGRSVSAEPGVDYAAPCGTAVVAPTDLTITAIQTVPSYATGRFIEARTASGTWFRFLHLSQVQVKVGQRVAQGARIALSGASGFGKDWHYGPHLHVSYWPGPASVRPAFVLSQDFDAVLSNNGSGGGGSPANEEEEWLMAAADDVAWTKDRVGGSTKNGASLTGEIRELKTLMVAQGKLLEAQAGEIEWLKKRVGGSIKDGASLTGEIRDIKS